ncbi:MAG: DNA polymerase III subunit delta [Candidatus Izemoplasmatales bacterium]|jgi:DNA polymerase-3 subunit delta
MQLANGIYFLSGTDSYLMKKKTEEILQSFQLDTMNTESYDMEEYRLDMAISHAMTIPFLTDYKGVILSNAAFLCSESRNQEIEQSIDSLIAYLDNPNPTTVLIIQAPYERLDRNHPVLKLLKTKAEICDCSSSQEIDVFQAVKDVLKNEKMTIEPNALQILVARAGTNRQMLMNELDKVMAYASGLDQVTSEIVREVVTKNPEENIFLLVNALIEGDRQTMVSIYQDLMSSFLDPILVIKVIATKFQEILYTKELLKIGAKQEEIMRYFSASKGRLYYLLKNAREVSEEKLFDFLSQIEKLDADIKTGIIDKQVGLELFLMKMFA